MGLPSVVFVVACLHALLNGSGAITFDCRSPQLACQNEGKCNTQTGACDCSKVNFIGYDCSVPSETKECSDASKCLNGAMCDVSNKGTDFCHCTESYYGNYCEMARISAVCNHNGMDVTLTPHEPFSGKLYVLEDPPLPADCQLTAGKQFTVAYDDSDKCGTYTSSHIEGKNYYSVKFVLQYSQMQLTSSDVIITIQCEEVESFSIDPVVKKNPVDDSTLFSATESESGTFTPEDGITIALQDKDGENIDDGSSVNFGSDIVAYIHQDVGGYTDFIVTDMIISGGTQKLAVVSGGCITADAKPLFGGVTIDTTTKAGEQSIKITTRVPLIVGEGDKIAEAIAISISVTVCTSKHEACSRIACDPENNAFLDIVANKIGTANVEGRRRRAVEQEESYKNGTRTLNLRVLDTLTGVEDVLKQGESVTSCRSMVFLVPMVLLAVMLLISMGTTLYFCLKVTRTWKKERVSKLG